MDVNPYLIKMLGYSREEFVEKKLWEVGAFKDIQASQDAFETLQENEYIRYEDLPLKTKGGQLIQVEFVSNVYLVGDEKVVQCDIREITEHKRIIAELQKNEKKYHDLVNQSPDGIFIVGSSGNFISVNKAMCKELKFSEEELLSMNIWDIIPERYLDQNRKRLTRILEGESLVDEVAEYEVHAKDGKIHYIDVLSAPHYSSKDIIGFQGIARDVTARILMERALRMRTEDLALVNALNEAVNRGEKLDGIVEMLAKQLEGMIPSYRYATVYLLDSDAKYLELWRTNLSTPLIEKIENLIGRPIPKLQIPIQKDSYFQKLLGNEQGYITSDPMIIQQWITEFTEATFLPPLIRDQIKKLVPQIYKLLNIKSVATIPLISSGRTIGLLDVSSSESVLTEDDLKRIRNISGQVTAVILQRQAEDARRESEEHYRILVDNTPDFIYSLDREGRHTAVNQSLCQAMNLPVEAIIGKNHMELGFPEASIEEWKEMRRRVILDGEMVQAETITPMPDGKVRTYEVTLLPIKDPSGQITGIRGVNRDISERRGAEEKIRRQLNRLAALREIDSTINSSLDMRMTLDTILAQIAAQLGVDADAILLLDKHKQILEYTAGRGFQTESLQHTRLQLGDSYAGRAALGRQIVHISDLQGRKTDFLRSPTFSQEGFVCYFGIPLIVKDEVKGVLEIFHRSKLSPDPEWLDFMETLAGQAAIAVDNSQLFDNLQRSNLELMQAYDATIEGWSQAMDLRDRETQGHSLRVTELTVRLAGIMGISKDEIAHIRHGALLHDMGKLGVPDAILFKPDKLTNEEWVFMKQHPQFAFDMLSPIAYLRPALDIPYCHHEKWDGTGYPSGLKGKEIPLSARIFAVIDVWDALTSHRPYRPAWSNEKALDYIREQSGRHFDPEIIEVFLTEIIKFKYGDLTTH